MPITFPLTLPSVSGFRAQELRPETVVGMVRSPWTYQQQVIAWPGQSLAFACEYPPLKADKAGELEAFFLALNGREGTFYLGPSIRKSTLGTAAGSWLVGAGAAANSTTLPLKSGTGLLVKGDWLQLGTGAAAQLKRVLQVNLDAGAMVSVDVFPRLRSAHAEDTAITLTNPVGVFRLSQLPSESYDSRKICEGMNFMAFEAIS